MNKYSLAFNFQIFIFAFCLLSTADCFSQITNPYNPRITRILFLLDGSGSMMDKWEGKNRFTIAKEMLYHLADSIEKSNDKVEFGLRIFGHQFPKRIHNCEDSKLEIPFRKNNASKIKPIMENITPQGWTPIAYSLFQAVNDFPDDPLIKNVIILITDGIETCEGDPCAVSVQLEKKRIVLKPFVIGLGMGTQGKISFDCVGYYYDANTEASFQNVLNVVVSQALNTTSVQVNLMNAYEQPTETETEMTFYDFHSGETIYNFVHALDDKGNPDTMYLSPVGKYNLTVHSIPPVTKKNIELVPGKHNIIAADVPQGTLNVQIENLVGFTDVQCVVRDVNTQKIIYVQDMNSPTKFIVGEYDLQILTVPRIEYKSVAINQSKTTEIKIPKPGIFSVISSAPGIASIYVTKDDKLEKVYEFRELTNAKQTVNLQPGEYKIVFRPNKERQSVLTQMKTFQINSGQVVNLKF